MQEDSSRIYPLATKIRIHKRFLYLILELVGQVYALVWNERLLRSDASVRIISLESSPLGLNPFY